MKSKLNYIEKKIIQEIKYSRNDFSHEYVVIVPEQYEDWLGLYLKYYAKTGEARTLLELMKHSILVKYSPEDALIMGDVMRSLEQKSILYNEASAIVLLTPDSFFKISLKKVKTIAEKKMVARFDEMDEKKFLELSIKYFMHFDLYVRKIDKSYFDDGELRDLSVPIELTIGIKSQHTGLLKLIPVDENEKTHLIYTYYKDAPFHLAFNVKTATANALIASFLYVLRNRKSAIVKKDEVNLILNSLKTFDKDRYLVEITDLRRAEKYIHELAIKNIKDLKFGESEKEKLLQHLKAIFPPKNDVFTLFTSVEQLK